MNRKNKPQIDKLKLGVNPFMANNSLVKIKVRVFTSNEVLAKHDSKANINEAVGNITNRRTLEEQTCTKVWHDTDYRDILLNLSEYELKLVLFIIYQLEPNLDYIWINSRLFQDTCGIREKKDYTKALEGLVRYSILTSTIYQDTYWINPLIIFSGNRITKYPDNIQVREEPKGKKMW